MARSNSPASKSRRPAPREATTSAGSSANAASKASMARPLAAASPIAMKRSPASRFNRARSAGSAQASARIRSRSARSVARPSSEKRRGGAARAPGGSVAVVERDAFQALAVADGVAHLGMAAGHLESLLDDLAGPGPIARLEQRVAGLVERLDQLGGWMGRARIVGGAQRAQAVRLD